MNNITDKDIRDAAKEQAIRVVRDDFQSVYKAGFIQGAKYVRREIQAQEMRAEQIKPMEIEIVVHSKEQERKAVEMFKSIGITHAAGFENFEKFLDADVGYPYKMYVSDGILAGCSMV